MQAHKSAQIFSFLLLLFPSSSECLYNISVSILSTMTLPTHPPSQTFHTESNLTSLGHFILKAKHSNLVYNIHTHTEYAAHTWSYHSKSNREAEGQKPNYCTINRPHRIFLFVLCPILRWVFETPTSCLFSTGSSGIFSFYNFSSLHEQPLSSALLLQFSFLQPFNNHTASISNAFRPPFPHAALSVVRSHIAFSRLIQM